MAEDQKNLSIKDYINQNNICNKYLDKLKNIIGNNNVEILSSVKEKQSALDKMKVRNFVSANQISDFIGCLTKRIQVQNKIIKHRKSLIFSLVIEILLSFLSLIESALSLNVFSFFNNLLKFMWTIFKEVKRLWSRKKT